MNQDNVAEILSQVAKDVEQSFLDDFAIRATENEEYVDENFVSHYAEWFWVDDLYNLTVEELRSAVLGAGRDLLLSVKESHTDQFHLRQSEVAFQIEKKENALQWRLCVDGWTVPAPRRLTAHRVNGLNDDIVVEVLDEPGMGGACHEYRMSLYGAESCAIKFQKGPIKEVGCNGYSHEALIAILIDRLEGFQSGQYACHDNQLALDHLQMARLLLHKRTLDRVSRGVEGTHNK